MVVFVNFMLEWCGGFRFYVLGVLVWRGWFMLGLRYVVDFYSFGGVFCYCFLCESSFWI